MTNPITRLAAQFNGPMMIAPESTASIEANLVAFSMMERAAEMLAAGAAADDGYWPEADSWQSSYRPYSVTDGVLSIPVRGTLLSDFSFATPYATGYEYIQRAWDRGMADPDVKGVVLSVNSGGGAASGNLDLVDRMSESKTKPVMGIAENAYSAAYAIISTADEIQVSRTGGVGSIGVVTGHVDLSGSMDQAGIKITHISAPEGGDKTEGSPYEKLSPDAKQRMQDRVDEIYTHFASTMSRNRGMDEKAIRDTKARTFTAKQGVANGLADKIASSKSSMAEFKSRLSNGDKSMTTATATVDQAAHDSAVSAARAAGVEEGRTAGRLEGATAERQRVNAILNCEEAKDRPTAALTTALETDLSLESAKAFIGKMPKEVAAAAPAAEKRPHEQPGFAGAMADTKNPNVGAGTGGEDHQADSATADHALAAARSFSIPGLREAK